MTTVEAERRILNKKEDNVLLEMIFRLHGFSYETHDIT